MQGRLAVALPPVCDAPNGLQWTDDGLWIVDQYLDDAYLVDETGEIIRKLGTPTENASGVTFGDGYLWTASNGETVGRPFRTTDTHEPCVLKLDPLTGALVDRFPTPDRGGLHGIEWDDGLLWITAFNPKALILVDPADFSVLRTLPVEIERLHGLARDGDGIWCAHTTDRVIVKYHVQTGDAIDRIDLPPDGPSPHGLSMRNGEMWYCDANFAGKLTHATRPDGNEVGRVVLDP